jgi:polyisoprenoid-binding protein YceI
MTTTATGVRYALDPAHSNASFAVRHLMVSKVRGHFGKISGTVVMPETGLIPLAVEAEIDASSIETREPQRDTHLRSEDFLHVDQHPVIRFTSTRVEANGESRFRVYGDLEIRGTKRPVTLDAETLGRGKDPWGNDRVGFEADARINRKDFGLVYNMLLEAGGVAVGDEVEIKLDVEATPVPA